MGFHYKVLGAPRRLKKDLERERLLDRIHEIEEILVGLGHLKRKRVVEKKKQSKVMGRKTKKFARKEPIHRMEEGSDDEDEEEE